MLWGMIVVTVASALPAMMRAVQFFKGKSKGFAR